MEFLRFLEGIRTPLGDAFFGTITYLGDETAFILIGLLFFWCINKKEGYYLLSIGFIGTILNQFLKLFFRIPRPWIKDKSFTIVESAKEAASGYSFPSGHTQSSVGIFGGIARSTKNRWVRIICIALCILVPFSRMYLGVHTPLDVGVSIIIALILIFGLYPITKKATENKNGMRILLSSIVLMSIGLLIFVSFYKFPENVDIHNLESGEKNAYKMLGCSLGVLLSFEIDNKFLNFKTEAPLLGQFFKFTIGLIPLLLIKEGLRTPLAVLLGGSFIADGIRYFLIVIFAACVWPLTFKHFAKISAKNQKSD